MQYWPKWESGYCSSPHFPSHESQDTPSVSCSMPPISSPPALVKVLVAVSKKNLKVSWAGCHSLILKTALLTLYSWELHPRKGHCLFDHEVRRQLFRLLRSPVLQVSRSLHEIQQQHRWWPFHWFDLELDTYKHFRCYELRDRCWSGFHSQSAPVSMLISQSRSEIGTNHWVFPLECQKSA